MNAESIQSGAWHQKPFHRGWECFVLSDCVNPTLTIPALAIRASDYLVKHYTRGEIWSGGRRANHMRQPLS